MKKIFLFLVFSTLILSGCSKNQPSVNQNSTTNDEVLENAINLYSQKKQQNTDFSKGPCLGIIAPDWVLDIAHNPRQQVDDQPENQCSDFKDGKAHHFIELDPDGNLIRIY